MTVLKGLIESADTGLVGTDYSFVDADTLVKDGQRYRIQGIDAPEVEKWVNDSYDFGTAGGAASTDIIRKLANEQGFTNVKPLLDENGEPQIDPFGRPLIDLVDETGQSFRSRILESGVLEANRYTTNTDRLTSEWGEMRRQQAALTGETTDNEWDQARTKLEAAMAGEGAKQLGFKRAALDETQLAFARSQGLGHYYADDTVQVRDYGRSLDNDSLNPFSDSWEQGWIGVKEASFGMLNLLGETTDSEWLADIGEAGVERARTHIRDYGRILTDYKDVKGFGDAVQYVTNNAALSLPYMAISIGGAAAAPFTAGVSLTAPAAVYAGQTWNEQEGDNKNAAIAIGSGVAQAALDRIGLGFIARKFGKAGGSKLLEEGIEALVAKGATREAATAQVMGATRKELAGFIGDAATVARNQITAKETFKKLAKGTLVGASGEAVTEALQESIGYTAAHTANGFETFNFQDLTDRALAGAVAGAALGGAFAVPGTVYDVGAWADVAVRQAPAEAARQSEAGKRRQEEIDSFGRVASNEENAANAKVRARAAPANTIPKLEERVDIHTQKRKDKSLNDKLFEAVTSAPALWRGATRWIFQPDILERSRSARILADMFGGQLQRTFSGSNFENAKHHYVTIYKNMVAQPDKIFSALNNGRRTSRRQRKQLSNMIYSKLRSAIDPDTKKFNPDLISDSDPHKALLVGLQGQLQVLADKMHLDQTKHNPNLGYLENYLLRYKSFNKKAIAKNRTGFIQALKEEFNMSDADASDLTHRIIDSYEINDIADALDGSGAAGKPGSHKARTLDLAEKDRFQDFMEQDIFSNVAAAAKSAARYNAYQEFIGTDNEVINQLLADIESETGDPDLVNKMAKQIQDYLAAESGNYKRPKPGTIGHKLQIAQRNFMMFTTLAGLPLATISSFVESALTMRALTVEQIFGGGKKPGGLYHLGNEFARTMWTGMQEVSSIVDHRQVLPAATTGKAAIQNLGFYDWDVGAATTTGATEINPWQQTVYENFFKWTGLQGWTNYTRSVRGAIAGDYISDKLDIILNADERTNEVQEAEEGLANIGINVQDMLEAYRGEGMFDPAKYDVVERNFREGMFNFINDAVALPQAQNRPLIYQDPRFALFTQFQGFIATFTANHIPKLWGEYVKRGTPAMKYNAFAVMATMIMLGFASQYLKDLIKYGEFRDFGPSDHPFLNTSEYVQRGIRASGLLGTGERVLDQFFPLYEKRSGSYGEWVFNTVTGESPAAGHAGRLAGGVGDLITGDVGGAAKEAVRATPLGPFNWLRNLAEEKAGAWNFSGE